MSRGGFLDDISATVADYAAYADSATAQAAQRAVESTPRRATAAETTPQSAATRSTATPETLHASVSPDAAGPTGPKGDLAVPLYDAPPSPTLSTESTEDSPALSPDRSGPVPGPSFPLRGQDLRAHPTKAQCPLPLSPAPVWATEAREPTVARPCPQHGLMEDEEEDDDDDEVGEEGRCPSPDPVPTAYDGPHSAAWNTEGEGRRSPAPARDDDFGSPASVSSPASSPGPHAAPAWVDHGDHSGLVASPGGSADSVEQATPRRRSPAPARDDGWDCGSVGRSASYGSYTSWEHSPAPSPARPDPEAIMRDEPLSSSTSLAGSYGDSPTPAPREEYALSKAGRAAPSIGLERPGPGLQSMQGLVAASQAFAHSVAPSDGAPPLGALPTAAHADPVAALRAIVGTLRAGAEAFTAATTPATTPAASTDVTPSRPRPSDTDEGHGQAPLHTAHAEPAVTAFETPEKQRPWRTPSPEPSPSTFGATVPEEDREAEVTPGTKGRAEELRLMAECRSVGLPSLDVSAALLDDSDFDAARHHEPSPCPPPMADWMGADVDPELLVDLARALPRPQPSPEAGWGGVKAWAASPAGAPRTDGPAAERARRALTEAVVDLAVWHAVDDQVRALFHALAQDP